MELASAWCYFVLTIIREPQKSPTQVRYRNDTATFSRTFAIKKKPRRSKSLILLAPRPGLEPGTYGLTVALKDVLYSSRFSLVLGNLLILIGYEYYTT